MKFLIVFALILGLLVGFKLNLQKKNISILSALKPGTLFITKGYSKDKESKAKVLAIDQRGNIKVYSLKIYPQDTPEYITTSDGKEVDVSGIQHLPLTEATLTKWDIKIVGFEPVDESELDGYKIWKDEPKAGAF